MKPIVFDLFCGLGGWSEAFITEGYQAIGFDIEAHDYGYGGYPGELVLRDVRSITGAELVREYGVPNVIVASPPCQEFSYMAMPWSKAKEKMRKILADPQERTRLCELFNQCFRIQREVSAAAGHYVPIIIENVRGAQKWVGKARWNFGSFYLWGDVPALMPIPVRARKTLGFSLEDKAEGLKAPGKNWNEFKDWDGNPDTKPASVRPWDGVKGIPHHPTGHWTNPAENGTKGGEYAWFNDQKRIVIGCGYDQRKLKWNRLSVTGSKSNARKAASAMIAKIPYPLAQWIARCYKPKL